MALKFLSVTSVPILFWSSPRPFTLRPGVVPVVFLFFGLLLFGLGEAMMVSAAVGVSPWTVFAEGITLITGWSLGFSTLIISVVVLSLWIPLKQIPGMGTVANVVVIAAVLQFVLPLLPTPETLFFKVFMCTSGVMTTGIGGAIYLIANLGPGPRDGLMTGLQRVTGQPIALVRSAIEIGVVVIGWTLGGTAGFGTVLFALGIGPAVAFALNVSQQMFADVARHE